MAEWLLNGRAIDGILGLVAIEAVALLAFRAARGRGPAPASLLCNLLSGAFLLLALRNALVGGSPLVIWACLSAGLAAHVADLIGRWDHGSAAERRPALRATVSRRESNARVVGAPRGREGRPSRD